MVKLASTGACFEDALNLVSFAIDATFVEKYRPPRVPRLVLVFLLS